jgi:predicted GIY-YIG superfamily endonuclease
MKPKYVRMLQRMAGDPRQQARTWSVYMLRCRDGTYYTGIAKDVQVRLRKHQAGKGAAYTRTRLPVELLYEENGLTRSEALVWEARIKAMPRAKKGRLAPKKD